MRRLSLIKKIKEDIACISERDPAARGAFEIITTYPGFHALLLHRANHYLWKMGFKWLARWFSALLRFLTGIEIHPAAVIGRRVFIDHGMGVVIGETSEVGDDCTLYHGVTLGGVRRSKGKRHPTLEDQVVIGAGAKILGPIRIGRGARVGSNAVVVKDVPAYATVVGVPGHLVVEKRGSVSVPHKKPFEAYGTAHNMPDPIEKTLEGIIKHLETLDKKIEAMRESHT